MVRTRAIGQSRLFQSTLSVRRATGHLVDNGDVDQISIHALRKESDKRLN